MAALLPDLRLALRSLRRHPTFTAVAIGSITLGIAANAIVFGIGNGLLGKPIAAADPDRLLRIGLTRRGADFAAFSYPEWRDLAEGATGLAGIVGENPNSVILSVGGEPQEETMELVTSNYFDVLGVRFTLGGGFRPESPGREAESGIVISDGLWRRRFGADPGVIGRTVRLNRHPTIVAGVAPPEFGGTFAGFRIALWVPAGMIPLAMPGGPSLAGRSDRFLNLIGRLKPGVTWERARGELAVLVGRMAAADTAAYSGTGVAVASASGIHPFLAGLVTAFLILLQGIVVLVLLITCANLANLVLARGAARQRELAVRAALGAGRWSLAQPLLVEVAVVAVVGGSLGLATAFWVMGILNRVTLPSSVPLVIDVSLDYRVAAFAVVATLVTVVAAGLWPALRAARPDLLAELRMGRPPTRRLKVRGRNVLVGVQVAVATVLLLNAGLLIRSFLNSGRAKPGFDSSGVLLLEGSPGLLGYDEDRGRALWETILSRARQVPGVDAASLALFVPLGDRSDEMGTVAAGATGTARPTAYNFVTPGYLAMLKIPLLAGRDFEAGDALHGPAVVLLSREAALTFFHDPSPLGRRLDVTERESQHRRQVEVVGVVADAKLQFPGEAPRPLMYLAFSQWYRPDMVLHVRSRVHDPTLARSLTSIVRQVEPDLAARVRSMDEATAFALIPLRVAVAVLGFAGFAGLALAVLGVAGVVAFVVARRSREIGIRMALGAERNRVERLIVLQGLAPVAVGLVIGAAAALAVGQLIRSLLVGVSLTDPATWLAVPLILLVAAATAAALPARRAARVDPLIVLREE